MDNTPQDQQKIPGQQNSTTNPATTPGPPTSSQPGGIINPTPNPAANSPQPITQPKPNNVAPVNNQPPAPQGVPHDQAPNQQESTASPLSPPVTPAPSTQPPSPIAHDQKPISHGTESPISGSAMPEGPKQINPVSTPAQPVNVVQAAAVPQQNLNPDVDKVKGAKPAVWSKFSGLFSIGQLIFGAVLLALVINYFLFQSYQVFGESMLTTLNDGDRLIISKFGKSVSKVVGDYQPARGDIIVFRSTINPDVQLIKRVIGLPGERVVVADGTITVYNEEFPDGFNPDIDYSEFLPPTTSGSIETVVGEGDIFVSGDNRRLGGSLDSRNELGNVPVENVVGELVLRIFPLSEAKFF